jgi:hypothetical protein
MPVRALINAHEAYKRQRETIKSRHRIELEAELTPEKEALGKEIAQMVEEGLNMKEITDYLGLKNRNYTYDMLRAYTKEPVRGKKKPEEIAIPEEEIPYQWTQAEGYYIVAVGNEKWNVLVDSNGDLELPDEWASKDKQTRDIFTKIVREIVKAGA